MNKEKNMTMKLNPYFESTIETSSVVWSHDENSYQFNFDFTEYLCDKPFDLTDGKPRILLEFLNDKNAEVQIYPLIVDSEKLGVAHFIIPDKILGYVGDVKASLTIDFTNKTYDLGNFYFKMKKSPIDNKMPQLQFYVDEFEKAIEKANELNTQIKDRDLVTKPELASVDNRKADKTSLNSVSLQLLDKADKSDVNTVKDEINNKADKKTVDSKISELTKDLSNAQIGLIGEFNSESELKEKYPNGSNGYAVVFENSVGYTYTYKNDAWAKGNVWNGMAIADDSIRNKHIVSSAINSRTLQNGSITTEKIGDYQITSGKIADEAIHEKKIKDKNIYNRHIGDNAINERVIADYAITSGKIADGAIHERKIKDKNIYNRHIGDNAIDGRVIGPKVINDELLDDEVVNSRKLVDNNVKFHHQDFIKMNEEIKNTTKSNFWISLNDFKIYSDDNLRSCFARINKNKHYKIKITGNINRLTIFSTNNLSVGEKGTVFYGFSGNYTDLKNDYTLYFNNDIEDDFLVIGYQNASGVSLIDNVDVTVTEIDNELNNFYETTQTVKKLDKIWYNYETKTLAKVDIERAIIVPISKNTEIEINTFGKHDRFVAATTNRIGIEDVKQINLVKVISDVAGDVTYTFKNGEDTSLYLGLVGSTNDIKKVEIVQRHKYLDIRMNDNNSTNIVQNDTGITTPKEISPVLWSVKMDNSRNDDIPRPIGWLYYIPFGNYPIYYASGNPHNLKYLCDWKVAVTWNKSSYPEKYHANITKDGDIICVWRGDAEGYGDNLPNVRQNPIIYKNNDWNNPKEISIVGTKPTAWLQSCGVDFISNSDTLIFAEYTRPSHKTANIWTVTKPFDNPENWKITQTYDLSGSNQFGMKHFHTINYDSFSGFVYSSTGDDDSAAKILESRDNGKTWKVVFEGNRRYARVLNFIFLKDEVYWANDDSNHGFFKAKRKSDKSVDFSNIETIKDLTGYPPTYANIYFENPNGILILNRYDGETSEKLDVLFYSLEDKQMHTVSSLSPTTKSTFGFRLESAELYPQRVSNGAVIGFADPINQINVLGNRGMSKNENNVNNLVLQVNKIEDKYNLIVETVFK